MENYYINIMATSKCIRIFPNPKSHQSGPATFSFPSSSSLAAVFCFLLGGRVWTNSFLWEFAENIRNMVKRRSQKANDSFEWRLVRCAWVGSARHEHLGSAERTGIRFAVIRGKNAFKFWEILSFLLFNVIGEISHQSFDRWQEGGLGWFHVLKLLQLLFYL